MRAAVAVLMVFVTAGFTLCHAQEFIGPDKVGAKLEWLDKEISRYQSKKTYGTLLMIVGGASLLSAFAFVPYKTEEIEVHSTNYGMYTQTVVKNHGDAAMFYGLGLGGTMIGLFGYFQYTDAADHLFVLRTQRRELTFDPLIFPRFTGVKVAVGF